MLLFGNNGQASAIHVVAIEATPFLRNYGDC